VEAHAVAVAITPQNDLQQQQQKRNRFLSWGEESRAEQRGTEESLVGSSDGVQANENSHNCNGIRTRDLKKGRETATGWESWRIESPRNIRGIVTTNHRSRFRIRKGLEIFPPARPPGSPPKTKSQGKKTPAHKIKSIFSFGLGFFLGSIYFYFYFLGWWGNPLLLFVQKGTM
jgi:hypothetical protein